MLRGTFLGPTETKQVAAFQKPCAEVAQLKKNPKNEMQI